MQTVKTRRLLGSIVIAVLLSGVILVASGCGGAGTSRVAPGIVGVSAGTSLAGAQQISLVVRSDTEHGRMGPDGRWHDAITPANLTLHAGRAVVVTIRNYDTAAHSFDVMGMRGASATQMMGTINRSMLGGSGGGMMTSSNGGMMSKGYGSQMMRTTQGSMIVAGTRMMGGLVKSGSASQPSVTRFVLMPRTRGVYHWYCLMRCDPWAMRHLGYMRGSITVA